MEYLKKILFFLGFVSYASASTLVQFRLMSGKIERECRIAEEPQQFIEKILPSFAHHEALYVPSLFRKQDSITKHILGMLKGISEDLGHIKLTKPTVHNDVVTFYIVVLTRINRLFSIDYSDTCMQLNLAFNEIKLSVVVPFKDLRAQVTTSEFNPPIPLEELPDVLPNLPYQGYVMYNRISLILSTFKLQKPISYWFGDSPFPLNHSNLDKLTKEVLDMIQLESELGGKFIRTQITPHKMSKNKQILTCTRQLREDVIKDLEFAVGMRSWREDLYVITRNEFRKNFLYKNHIDIELLDLLFARNFELVFCTDQSFDLKMTRRVSAVYPFPGTIIESIKGFRMSQNGKKIGFFLKIDLSNKGSLVLNPINYLEIYYPYPTQAIQDIKDEYKPTEEESLDLQSEFTVSRNLEEILAYLANESPTIEELVDTESKKFTLVVNKVASHEGVPICWFEYNFIFGDPVHNLSVLEQFSKLYTEPFMNIKPMI